MATQRPRRPGWRLVWSDEFDGTEVDRSKWDFDLGNGFYDERNRRWIPGWGNEELQYYTDDPRNVSVRDSLLTIRALKESMHGCDYTSARLKTRRRDGTPLYSKVYGRFEVRARVPWGKGLWPALWMLPQADAYGGWAASGEIDLMEIVGERPHEVLSSIHFGSSYPERSMITHVHALPGGASVADWHEYAVEWEPGEIRFYVDGEHTTTRDHWWSCSRTRDGHGLQPRRAAELNPWPAPFDRPFYILMNVAVGGNFPGAPNEQTRFPAELVVDYVRVYDKVGGYGDVKPIGRGRFPWRQRAG
ncbi:MAG: glycoside hydrolase family 16 protein [Burkholderiales bacterium]|nr:glycoside hydrolase family 16 protein [Burkholderiales bacterium]MDE1926539.1 glycoside hydrolase family 16 protein [Burkholderiales bacterium]MDE2501660.1 glycoside hydrolase family 16 protein [Burkholderiales bacterium]